jgi:antitoxin HicB
MTHYLYPARFRRGADGRVTVSFPDLPEALTDGADFGEAMAEARDCLSEALMNRIAHNEDIPAPSAPRPRQHLVAPDPLVATKAALHRAMAGQGLTVSELARRLGADRKDVRRLLDPRHRSTLAGLSAALGAVGGSLSVVVQEPQVRTEASD